MHNFISGTKMRVAGYTGMPAEMRFTPSGKSVTTVSVGVGGGKERPAKWYKIEAWDGDADALNEALQSKGIAVIVVGNLVEPEAWNSSDGKIKSQVKLGWLSSVTYYDKSGQQYEVELPSQGSGSERGAEPGASKGDPIGESA